MSPEDSAKATQRHFDQELNDLRELLLRMAGRAEEQMRSGLTAVKRLDAQAAQQTILTDRDVDALELEIEERAINLLARRQPMAGDLRTLIAVLKISNDLERVVTARYPAVKQHLEWLREREANARMTGSGSCVFAEFERREDAEAVMRELPAPMQGFVAQGLKEHPLGQR